MWHPHDHYLLFSDMPADVRRRWDARGGVREVMRPSNKCNGMSYDANLNLIVCEHATSTVVREYPDGRRETLASHYNGLELNSPNDVCVHSSGAIYFSDPWYGRMPVYGVERPRQLGFQGVYRIPPGGGPVQLLVDRMLFNQPNGLCFSPDESRLYVNDTVKTEIRGFDVKADGTLSSGRLFASGIKSAVEPGVPDGMKCDRLGNVWVTAPGGIWVYAPSGELLGKVRVAELVSNLHWGGDNFETLFMTATHSVYSVKTRVGGRLEPFMRAGPQPAGRRRVYRFHMRRNRDLHRRGRVKTNSYSIRRAARSSSRICRTMSSWMAAHSHLPALRRTPVSRTSSRTSTASPTLRGRVA